MDGPTPAVVIQTVAAAISALAAIGAVVMARWTVLESRRLREAQTSPEVVVYLERNDRVRNVVDLVVRNLGAGPAYFVTFAVPDKPIPFRFVKDERVYILRNGINFFPPGHRFSFSLNTYTELPKDEITVDVSYYAKDEIERGQPRRQSFTLRPLEFEGVGEWQDREREVHIATKQGMGALAKAMDAFRTGRIKLTVRPDVPRHPDPEVDPLGPTLSAERIAAALDAAFSTDSNEGNLEPPEAAPIGHDQ